MRSAGSTEREREKERLRERLREGGREREGERARATDKNTKSSPWCTPIGGKPISFKCPGR